MKKILWVVNYDSMQDFLDTAVRVGATGVAIRTDNDVVKAITAFHAPGIQVFGWRWPSAKRDAAMKEAAKALALFEQGMDGYFVDPEGAPGQPYDWDRPGLAPLAAEFCAMVADAAGPRSFGVTSHYRGKKVYPKLPWAAFFKRATVLLPQAYWHVDGGVVGHGLPADNYRVSIDFWQATGGKRALIVPMAGELHR